MKRLIKYLAFVSLIFSIVVSFAALSHGQTKKRSKKTVAVSRKNKKPIVTNNILPDKSLESCLTCSNKPKPDIYQYNSKTEQKFIISDCNPVTLKLIFQPEPKYPKSARFLKSSRSLKVDVIFDETGKVIWAKVIEGHPLLRNETLRIVCLTRIKPPIDCSGLPTKINPIMIYNVLP